jgi:uncharacterized protein
MKLSNFNVIIPTKNPGDYLLANMMSGAVIAVDEELKTVIETGALDACDAETCNTLKDLGVLIPDDVDEYRKFKVGYESRKYTVTSPNFTLITTYACNLACPYCYEGKGELLHGTMTEDTRERTVTFIQKTVEKTGAKTFSIALYGGEPLLNFDDSVYIMDSCFTWAEDKGIDYTNFMLTNGTLVTPEIAETLHHYKARAVQLTLDGPKRLHNKRRIYKNGKGTYDDIIEAAVLLRDHKVPIGFRFNVDSKNKEYIGDLLDELEALGLHDVPVLCGIVTETQACRNYTECIQDKDVRMILSEFRDTLEKRGYSTVVERPHSPKHLFCGFLGEGTYVLDPHADVYKCLTFVGLPPHCIGHLDTEGDLVHTWAYYDWMSRDPLYIDECRRCTMLPACGGGCAATAYEKHGTYHACGCYDPYSEMRDQLKRYLEKESPQHFRDEKIIWD